MKKIVKLFIISLITYSGFSQSAGNYVYQKLQNQTIVNGQPTGKNIRSLNGRTLTIEASALMNIVPDAQIAIFTLVQLGNTALEATELMDSKIEPIKQELKTLGIKSENIVVDMVSFMPHYEDTIIKKRFSKTYTEIPKGFELKKNIHIKFKNHEVIDKIIAICANHEVYDLAKVEYVVFDNEENKQSMREHILKHIANKIAFYHDLQVQDDIEIIQINEVNNEYYPLDRYQSYKAFSSSSFEVLSHNSKKQKDIKQLTKNNSIFYDPLSTKHFDIVLNPGILEPTVQYTTTLTVSYTLPVRDKEEPIVKEKIVEKKEFILITPNGDTKVLQL